MARTTARTTSLLERVAEFALGLELGDVPEAKVQRPTRILADTL